MPGVYYNDLDPFVCAWLRELIKAGLLPDGEVDERSILEIRAEELKGFRQCHFFAGIGGWPLAFRRAGIEEAEGYWSGSCPCQPLSSAGQHKGHADHRHLWPAFYRLIAECTPPVVFGEQVASEDGREWLAGVRADLEAVGYAIGSADLCAAGIGAPHIRQRLYWVADSQKVGRLQRKLGNQEGKERQTLGDQHFQQPHQGCGRHDPPHGGGSGRLAHANEGECGRQSNGEGSVQHGEAGGRLKSHGQPQSSCDLGRVHDTAGARQQPARKGAEGPARDEAWLCRPEQGRHAGWGGTFIACSDGKARRVEPGIQPLAHGVSNRVGTLRGAGNAIVPQVAATFIQAFASINPPEMTK